jgi:hypothetical protein
MWQARHRQSQVCGVHGWGSSGFGQQVQLRPLSNPDPGARVISPGRPVFWRVTRSPPLAWLPGSDQPTKQAGTAKSEPYRAPSPYSPAGGPDGHVWVRPAARRHNGRRLLHDGAPDRPAGECPAWVGLAKPTNRIVESPLEPFLTTGWHANGPVRKLGATHR